MIYYNENDPSKAEWLRQLMARDVIAKGIVDERSILEIKASDLGGYTQCHFFAGIGIWSYAMRQAGWPDERPVWTGSCPCQPFSVAGKQKGTLDERHLWPAWFRLIAECRPGVVFGEQVADGDGISWLDNVQTDMESKGYRFGPLVLPAAGFGAPHGRHRIMFVADTLGANEQQRQEAIRKAEPARRGSPCSLANGNGERRDGQPIRLRRGRSQQAGFEAAGSGTDGDMADATGPGRNGGGQREKGEEPREEQRPERLCAIGELGDTPESGCENAIHKSGSCKSQKAQRSTDSQSGNSGPTNGFWADAEWIPCRGKIPGTVEWRPIKPGAQPMADGSASDILRMCDYGFALVKGGTEARTLRLKGYGDGICAPAVAEFIKAYLSIN